MLVAKASKHRGCIVRGEINLQANGKRNRINLAEFIEDGTFYFLSAQKDVSISVNEGG